MARRAPFKPPARSPSRFEGGPGRDLLRRIYRCPRPLTDKQYQKARPLWKVDLVLDPVEFVIEAVVLRPYELSRRWKHRRRRAGTPEPRRRQRGLVTRPAIE